MNQWDYQEPRWLPGGHLQTIHASLFAKTGQVQQAWRRQRWITPDEDFIDVDWLDNTNNNSPLLILFHGLEGSSQSHYAKAFAHIAQQQQWQMVVVHFRGCGGEINLAPRAYHSGDYQEIHWMMEQIQKYHAGRKYVVGISLGGNALMRWVQESGATARQYVRATCAVCSPLDLYTSGHAIGQGINRYIYTPWFLGTMKPRALHKLKQFPALFNREQLMRAKDLYDFDNVFTAPLHGFKNTQDYWTRASAKPHMRNIALPSLVIHAQNDPFIPAHSLPKAQEVSQDVELWQPRTGGHVGFVQGAFAGDVLAMPQAVVQWFQRI
ncbi:MAG: alpha/beta fold hydrolase [Limnohabitans sp.]|nr:alpha/beta fold hydrolase [Limnohabitans sp.]